MLICVGYRVLMVNFRSTQSIYKVEDENRKQGLGSSVNVPDKGLHSTVGRGFVSSR